MRKLSVKFMLQLHPRRKKKKSFSQKPGSTYFDIALMWSVSAPDCLHPAGVWTQTEDQGWTTAVQYVFKSLFCLSGSVCGETSNLFVWTHSWRGVRTGIDRDQSEKASAHIVHSAHILLIQFWEIALPQKKKEKKRVVIILSLSVPRWHLQQITSAAKRNATEKIWSHVSDLKN